MFTWGEDYLALQELSEGVSPEIFRYRVVLLQACREIQKTGKPIQKWKVGDTHIGGCALSLISPSSALIAKLPWFVYFHDCSCSGIACLPPPPPGIILNAVEDDYQMILHVSLCPIMWLSTSRKGKPKAALKVMALWGLKFMRKWAQRAATETKRSSSSPRGPLSSSPFGQYISFLWIIPWAKELSVRADNKIQPRRKIHIQSMSQIRVLSTGKSEPHLIDKWSFWLSIIKTLVAMAVQSMLQL